jgi:hypothetical protein
VLLQSPKEARAGDAMIAQREVSKNNENNLKQEIGTVILRLLASSRKYSFPSTFHQRRIYRTTANKAFIYKPVIYLTQLALTQ